MSGTSLIDLGAAEIARRVAARDLSATEIVNALIERIEEVNTRLNAVVVPMFDQARQDAQRADDAVRRGKPLGPLHGVPMTIKECFHVAGTPSTIGLSARQNLVDEQDGILVQRLRSAGAIILGKTNVSQLMMYQESANPVYGATCHPVDEQRSPGGSSGGEAAVIAAGGSPLGLGSDMGGSIRQPCHACGIQGIKPTSGRLPTSGLTTNLPGMEAIAFQPGPMARHVEDLTLALKVLSEQNGSQTDLQSPPGAIGKPNRVDLSSLRIGKFKDDGLFLASPAIRRAVDEAGTVLQRQGATVETFEPPDVGEAVELFCAILAADGASGLRRLLRGSKVDWRMSRLMLPARIPRLIRPVFLLLMQLLGQQETRRLFGPCRSRSADEY